MATKRKTKSDSVSAAIESFRNARLVIEPSIKLDEAEIKVFHELINARPIKTWQESDVDVRTASTLARQVRMQEQLMEEILIEGASIDDGGRKKMNPKFSASEMLGRTIFAGMRHLGLSSVQRGLRLQDHKNQTALEASSRGLVNAYDDVIDGKNDSLLA